MRVLWWGSVSAAVVTCVCHPGSSQEGCDWGDMLGVHTSSPLLFSPLTLSTPPPPAPCPQVPEAVCLPTLTYNEAWELSYFGANVLHPRTTLPAMRYKIPIAIRNFFNLDAPGVKGGDCWGGWVCVCM